MRSYVALLCLACVILGFSAAAVLSQPPGPPRGGFPGKGPKGKGPPRQISEAERAAIAERFIGVTTDGAADEGLFAIRASGVSTEPVVAAAKALLAGLSEADRAKTLYPVDDREWRQWDNRHFAPRQGVGFKDMTGEQRELAFALFRASLSARGLKQTQDIMKLNGTLAELTNNFDEYGEWLYWVTIMGEPSMTEPWGWQLDGHHVIVNYFVLGDQVVMTPVFMGSEPIRATSGKFAGTEVLQAEQDQALAFFQSLDDEQRTRATIAGQKGPTNNLSEAYRDNLVLDYAGIPAKELNDSQKEKLLELVGLYVGNMDDGHARVKMDDVEARIDETYFAWIGEATDDGVFYYRVHSPVILIEFDHQRPIALDRSMTPTRNHIHTVVRTPNGNDYGKDLLRLHHAEHPH